MDLQVQGVELLVAQSQICLQPLFGLVEVDKLSASVLHLGSQLIPLLAQFLRSRLSVEQLENKRYSEATRSALYSLSTSQQPQQKKKKYKKNK